MARNRFVPGAKPWPPPAPPPFNPPGQAIVNLAPPDPNDAVTKAYIDGARSPALVECSYCGRGGVELETCEGCGATVRPRRRASSAKRSPIPSFDMVRRRFPPNRIVR